MCLNAGTADTTICSRAARCLWRIIFTVMFLTVLSAPALAQLSASLDSSVVREAEGDDELLNLSLRIHPPIIETDEDVPMKYDRRMGYPPADRPAFADDEGLSRRCTWSLSQASAHLSAGGGPLTVRVTTGAGCVWQATGGIPWLIIVDGQSGNGSGTVNCVVSPNPGPHERIGAITIGGQVFAVTQKGEAGSVRGRNYSRMSRHN